MLIISGTENEKPNSVWLSNIMQQLRSTKLLESLKQLVPGSVTVTAGLSKFAVLDEICFSFLPNRKKNNFFSGWSRLFLSRHPWAIAQLYSPLKPLLEWYSYGLESLKNVVQRSWAKRRYKNSKLTKICSFSKKSLTWNLISWAHKHGRKDITLK